ncbi:hypothetical protein OAO18_07680 [Francisellaceae bacterium]|nr:hypothetical protein [Francisellaceae bacterium]
MNKVFQIILPIIILIMLLVGFHLVIKSYINAKVMQTAYSTDASSYFKSKVG